AYDTFYLQICRKVFTIIRKLALKHRDKIDLNEDESRALAYVITACFEDEVNGFGFWQALVRIHQKQFGKRLPFFSKDVLAAQEAESDDILPADIHYLLFVNYLALANDRDEEVSVFFANPFFHETAQEIYEYLSGIDEVETTDFYDSYLIPDDDYIDFKGKLSWFVLHGYLTGMESSLRIDNYLTRLREEKERDVHLLSSFLYAEQDRLLFEQPSRFTAFIPVDIFAEALRCDETKKEAVKALKLRPHGVFQIQDETNEHFTFLHTATQESFTVLKSSFSNATNLSAFEYWITTLAEWNGQYNISGLCLPVPMKAEELADYNLQHQHEFQRYYPPYREKLLQTADEFRDKALQYFGNELITFPDGAAMEQKVNEFHEWYFTTVTEKKHVKEGMSAIKIGLPADFKKAKDVALFLPPHDNITFLQGHMQTLKTLQAPHPEQISTRERNDVLALIAAEDVDADYWFYLRKNHPLPNLSYLLKGNYDSDEDFEALLRIYKPRDFSPLKLPRFTLFSSDEMPVEKVSKLLNPNK
ncbi:MAG: DUF3843 family protein, partial [Pyrinomonadaceae bacterium]|nr:DUF3843 family protein [Pyrinomonadaceae bacterium]